jgi:hypothetical protein
MQSERRLVVRRSLCFLSTKCLQQGLSNVSGGRKTISNRYGRLRHRATMNLHCCYGMTIRRCCAIRRRCCRANMSHRRCCAIPNPIQNMIRESHCVALADCSGAHYAVPAGCIWARLAALATNCPAVLWALRLAGADPAEACCFRQTCPDLYGQPYRLRKLPGQNRDLQLKYGLGLNRDPGLNRGPRRNRGRRWTEISANRRFPVCAKTVRRRGQTIATSRN